MIISGAEEQSALVRVHDKSHPAGFFDGELLLPWNAYAIAVFAQGSGSSRFSPRSRLVAQILRGLGIGTFLIDISTADKAEAGSPSQSELELMAGRIIAAYGQLREEPLLDDIPVGLYGSGTGGAAGLVAAALEPDFFRALVLRGARLELAGSALALVRPPTLLIAGSKDVDVVRHYRECVDLLGCPAKLLELVPGADHNFEEPGALAAVALKASHWFEQFMTQDENAPLKGTRRYAYLETAAEA